MAVNVCTSSTGTVTGTDPNFTLTRAVRNRREGVFLYLQLTAGTTGGITIGIGTICRNLSATDVYSAAFLTTAAVTALSFTIAATGNYKIPIALSQFDDTVVITITPTSAAADGVIVANIMEQ